MLLLFNGSCSCNRFNHYSPSDPWVLCEHRLLKQMLCQLVCHDDVESHVVYTVDSTAHNGHLLCFCMPCSFESCRRDQVRPPPKQPEAWWSRDR